MNEVDLIRLEEFRQLKKEIRGSEEYLIVGLDVGKGDVGSETTYDIGLLVADSASCFRTYVPYYCFRTYVPYYARLKT